MSKTSLDTLSYIYNDFLYDELYDSHPDLDARRKSLFSSAILLSSNPFLSVESSRIRSPRCIELLYAAVWLFFLLLVFVFFYITAAGDQEKLECSESYLQFQSSPFCYKVHLEISTFQQAQATCHTESANLVSIHSEEENNFIVGLSSTVLEMNNRSNIDFMELWTGLTYSNITKSWSWTDGSPVDFENWMQGEPAYLETDRWVTVSLNIQGDRVMQWNNLGSYHGFIFVCKKPLIVMYQ